MVDACVFRDHQLVRRYNIDGFCYRYLRFLFNRIAISRSIVLRSVQKVD